MLTALYLLAAVVGVMGGAVVVLWVEVRDLRRRLSDRHYGYDKP